MRAIHKFVCFNSEIIERDKALVPAAGSAVFYGRSVFTTIAVRNGKLLFWEKHLRRLRENAEKLGIDFPGSSPDVQGSLSQLLETNAATNALARVTLLGDGNWVITTSDPRKLPERFKVTLSPHGIDSRSPLAGVKSGNYLENIIAIDETRSRGFDEAVVLNERREVASGVMANIFWFKGGKLFTPSLTTGCLAGTTREFVLENLDCREVETGLDEIETADAIYLTSAGLGIVQVWEFDGRKLSEKMHSILDLLA